MIGLIDVKSKGSASVGYLVQYVTLTFDLTHDPDLGCFKVKFGNSSISGIVGLIDLKWKWSELIWIWADCMTLPFDHTHDLDLGVEIWRSESEIALSQEWDGRLTWNEKDVSHPFMTMILTSVTMVGGWMYRIVTGVTSDADISSCHGHDDIIKWKHFTHHWPFVREFTGHHELPSQKPVRQRFDVFFDLRLNKSWANNWDAGDLRHHPAV